MNELAGIKTIYAREAFSIDHRGVITTDAESVVQEESTLKIGTGGGSIFVGNSINIGNGSIFSGGSTSMNIDGVSVQSVGGKFILKGPSEKILVVNGVQTTFGSINESASTNERQKAPRKTYKLAENTLIGKITMSHGDCSVHGKFLNENLGIILSGAGSFELPARTFSHLNLTISGSGDICGASDDRATKSLSLHAAIFGSGDISDIIVLERGNVSIFGSGDITIEAIDPESVIRSVSGSGRVRVGGRF